MRCIRCNLCGCSTESCNGVRRHLATSLPLKVPLEIPRLPYLENLCITTPQARQRLHAALAGKVPLQRLTCTSQSYRCFRGHALAVHAYALDLQEKSTSLEPTSLLLYATGSRAYQDASAWSAGCLILLHVYSHPRPSGPHFLHLVQMASVCRLCHAARARMAAKSAGPAGCGAAGSHHQRTSSCAGHCSRTCSRGCGRRGRCAVPL